MISSNSNPQVKNLIALQKKAKARQEQGVFIAEGIKMFGEAPRDRIQKVYVAESFYLAGTCRGELEECSVEVLSDTIFQHVSDTSAPQGILAVIRRKDSSLEMILNHGACAHLLFLETIQDPGNLGTILRTAEGAGVTGVVMDSKTVDSYNPKTIRSTMGSIYRVPFLYVDDFRGAIKEVKASGVRIFAAHLDGEHNYNQENYKPSSGFLIGNEANGLTLETALLADTYIKIPMAGQLESLNAAIAASILMYEAFMQRE